MGWWLSVSGWIYFDLSDTHTTCRYVACNPDSTHMIKYIPATCVQHAILFVHRGSVKGSRDHSCTNFSMSYP